MYCIAIDLGGTIIKIGLVKGNEILEFSSFPAIAGSLGSNLPARGGVINRLLSKWKVPREELAGMGLAFPGMVNPKEKRVTSTNDKYDDACDIDLPSWVDRNWGTSFIIDNDARLALAGEWYMGAGKNSRNMVMMTIGTGIGTGVVLDGRIIKGTHYQAGSLGGHIVVDYRGRRCTCGNIGCVEAMASSFFLPEIIRTHPKISSEYKAKASSYDFKTLFDLMRRGEPEATLLCKDCMDVWAAAIINYIHAYDPEIVVIGGGIMRSADIILPYLKERIDRLVWAPENKVKITTSLLGDNAALLGISCTLSTIKKEKCYEQIF